MALITFIVGLVNFYKSKDWERFDQAYARQHGRLKRANQDLNNWLPLGIGAHKKPSESRHPRGAQDTVFISEGRKDSSNIFSRLATCLSKGAALAIRAKYGALVPIRETPEKSGAKFSEHIIGAAVNFLPTEFTTWTAERADRWSPAFQMQDPYTTVCILAHSLNSDARKIQKLFKEVNADFNDFDDFFKKIIFCTFPKGMS